MSGKCSLALVYIKSTLLYLRGNYSLLVHFWVMSAGEVSTCPQRFQSPRKKKKNCKTQRASENVTSQRKLEKAELISLQKKRYCV